MNKMQQLARNEFKSIRSPKKHLGRYIQFLEGENAILSSEEEAKRRDKRADRDISEKETSASSSNNTEGSQNTTKQETKGVN